MDNRSANLDRPGSRKRFRILSLQSLIVLVVLLTICAGVFVFGLRKVERDVAFHPVRDQSGEASIVPPGAEDVWFVTKDGHRLHGWFFQSKAVPATATIIYFHGNGGNVKNSGWLGEHLATRGFSVLLFDYRGYGRSEGYLEDEAGLYADADAAYEYVTTERGVSPQKIVLYGQSLGTTAVADLAARHECAAIIMESGLSSGSDMAKVVLPLLPHQLYFLAKNRFDSAGKLPRVHCPVLITHGELDETVPAEQAQTLFAAANPPKKLIIFPGADHDFAGSLGDQYLNIITEFINDPAKFASGDPATAPQ
jgi:fermentation-respiration switch protein FrsA (DUF1100 family)